MKEISIFDSRHKFTVIFVCNAEDEVLHIEVMPHEGSAIPHQIQELSVPIPLVPHFIRIESVIPTLYLRSSMEKKPCGGA